MTQQQLVETVWIEVKGTANRIAQYECDYRIPLNDMLMNSSLNPPFEMGDQAKPKRCLEY